MWGGGGIDLDTVDNDVWRRSSVAAASMDDVTAPVTTPFSLYPVRGLPVGGNDDLPRSTEFALGRIYVAVSRVENYFFGGR